MSDSYYQERARRRARILWIVGAVAIIAILVVIVIWSLYRDSCTRSFDRSPTAIVSTFLESVGRGEMPTAQACWEHDAFYELEAGCSEICLSKVYGAQFEIVDIVPGEPYITPQWKSQPGAHRSHRLQRGWRYPHRRDPARQCGERPPLEALDHRPQHLWQHHRRTLVQVMARQTRPGLSER